MKILIIEDYEGDVALMTSRLQAIGCEPLVARSAAEGLRIARAERPGLIVTDLNLGAGIEEGIEMLGSLRADPETADIPVVLHSVFVSHGGDVPEAQARADGFLPKPYRLVDLTRLVATIRAAAEA